MRLLTCTVCADSHVYEKSCIVIVDQASVGGALPDMPGFDFAVMHDDDAYKLAHTHSLSCDSDENPVRHSSRSATRGGGQNNTNSFKTTANALGTSRMHALLHKQF